MLIAEALNGDKVFRAHFCERVGRQPSEFASAEADGKHAKQEVSVLGGTTAGKTDLSVLWKDGLRTNVSIKKAANGQVYLVTAKNFVAAFEAQYGVKVPNEVSKALALFIGESPDSKSILTSTNIEVDGHQVRKCLFSHASSVPRRGQILYNNPALGIKCPFFSFLVLTMSALASSSVPVSLPPIFLR